MIKRQLITRLPAILLALGFWKQLVGCLIFLLMWNTYSADHLRSLCPQPGLQALHFFFLLMSAIFVNDT